MHVLVWPVNVCRSFPFSGGDGFPLVPLPNRHVSYNSNEKNLSCETKFLDHCEASSCLPSFFSTLNCCSCTTFNLGSCFLRCTFPASFGSLPLETDAKVRSYIADFCPLRRIIQTDKGRVFQEKLHGFTANPRPHQVVHVIFSC